MLLREKIGEVIKDILDTYAPDAATGLLDVEGNFAVRLTSVPIKPNSGGTVISGSVQVDIRAKDSTAIDLIPLVAELARTGRTVAYTSGDAKVNLGITLTGFSEDFDDSGFVSRMTFELNGRIGK
jgi:hypothetical protein